MTNYIEDTQNTNVPTGSVYRLAKANNLPFPHRCSGCGSSSRDCLDLNIYNTDNRFTRDQIGSVLLCVLCYRNTADVMGYVYKDEADLMVKKAVLDALDDQEKYKLLTKTVGPQLHKLRAALNEFERLVGDIQFNNSYTSPVVEPSVIVAIETRSGTDESLSFDDDRQSELFDEGTEGTEPIERSSTSTGSTEREDDESASSERSSGISADSSIFDFSNFRSDTD